MNCNTFALMTPYYIPHSAMVCICTPHTAGAWTSPATTGERPPPCSGFSLTSIGQWKAIMFGGYNKDQGFMNDVFIIDLQSMVCELITV